MSPKDKKKSRRYTKMRQQYKSSCQLTFPELLIPDEWQTDKFPASLLLSNDQVIFRNYSHYSVCHATELMNEFKV